MKKYLSLILVLFLFVCCTVYASAEFEANLVAQLTNSSVYGCGYSTFIIEDRNTQQYYIYDETMTPSQTGYASLKSVPDAVNGGYDLFEASSGDGVNSNGYVTKTGEVKIPLSYCDLDYLSARWQVGIYVEKSEASLSDFKDWEGNTYRISYYDVYYMNNKVLTLQRDEYAGSGYAYAYGDYLIVKDIEGIYTAYDKNGNVSTNNYIEYSSEYLDNYKQPVIHQPTGQIAFNSACTLTSDEVKDDLYITGASYIDLQGNLLPLQHAYSSVSKFEGNYAPVELLGKHGLIDRQGNEVIPCQFDNDLSYYYAEQYEKYGYIAASMDGKFCFVNAKGEITYQSPYNPDVVKSYSGIIRYVHDLTGNYIVLTPEGGQMEEQFSYVESSKSLFCCAETLDGQPCVIDIFGNKILSAGTDTNYYYLSADSKIIVEQLKGGIVKVYSVSGGSPNAESPLAAEMKEDKILAALQKIAETAEIPAPTPALIDSGSCGANAEWKLTQDGTLYISGSGRMVDYEPVDSGESAQPWSNHYESIKTIIIEDGITSIGEFAFGACPSITKVTIPDSVTSIGSFAFVSCAALTDIAIPNSVTNIGDAVFLYCESLTSITIPSSVTSISKGMFFGCTSLSKVDIPNSITYIGSVVFDECPNLKEINFSGSREQWAAIQVNSGNEYLQQATVIFNGTNTNNTAETAVPVPSSSETLSDRKAPEIEYDAQGRKTKETTFFPDGSIDKITSYKYDLIESRTEDFYADGKLVLSRIFFDSEFPTMELVFGYNEQGKRTGIGTYTYDGYGQLSAITGASDQIDGVPWHRTFSIDGNTVRSMLYSKDNTALSECLCVYDNAKNLISEDYTYRGGGRSEKIDYTYNAKGLLTNKAGTFILKDSKIEITNTYEYDTIGNPVKETGYICSYSGSQKDGREASYEQIFEYDPAGTLIKTARRENNDNYRTVTEYQYDSHGNVAAEKKYKLTDGAAENQVTAYELTEHSYEYDGDRIVRETVSGNEEKTIYYISEGTAYIKSEGDFYDTFYEPNNDLPKYNISSFQSGNKNYAVYNMQYSPNPGSFDQCQCFWEGSGDVNIRYKPLEGLNTRIFLTFANGADCFPETDFGGVYVLF